jgi:hypothetical protein
MSGVVLDRLLETCLKHGGRAILVPGAPPLLRGACGLRPLLLPALDEDEIRSLICELNPAVDELDDRRGFRSFRVRYGSEHRFYVAAVGRGAPKAAVLMLGALELPEPVDVSKRPDSAGESVTWGHILQRCDQDSLGDAILAPGCSPLLWSEDGMHAYPLPSLSEGEISSLVNEVNVVPQYVQHGNGYLSFPVRYDQETGFVLSVFGSPQPHFVFVMKRPAVAPRRGEG